MPLFFWYWGFWFFGIISFLVLVLGGTILWLFRYMQSAPLLRKLDNVVHEDEYLAPEVFRDVSRAVHGAIASRPTNGRN